MKQINLKLVSGLIALTVGLFSGMMISEVKAQGLTNNSQQGNQLFCTRDFGNFLANGIDLDGEGFWDYWLDILDIPGYGFSRYSNNYCRFNDIDSLLNRVDKSRKQLRQAFYVCDNVAAQRIAKEYYQLSAELWYLRHFVDTNFPPNSKGTEAEKTQSVTKRSVETNWTEFKVRFVDKAGYFSIDQASVLFNKLEAKYASKLQTYRECKDPNLANLEQKWKEFRDGYKTIAEMGKQFADRTSKKVEKTRQRIVGNGGLIGGAFSSKSFGNYLENLIVFRVNSENGYTKTPWENIAAGFEQNAPTQLMGDLATSVKNEAGILSGGKLTGTDKNATASNPNPSFDSIYGDLQTAAKRDESIDLDLFYFGELEIKYRQTSGMGLDNLLVNLDILNQTIMDSDKPMKEVRYCAANIVGKQCGK